MIDPSEPLTVQVEKQAKIIKALMERANHRHELGGSAYSLFQSAVTLQGKVSEKTRDLERALTTLGRASYRLETSEVERAQSQQSLTDALESMDGGFALFTAGKLRVFNDFFKSLVPGVGPLIQPGLSLAEYFRAVAASPDIVPQNEGDRQKLSSALLSPGGSAPPPFVFALRNDRWFVISYRRTRSNNTVVLQTEITSIVRSNRLEKNRLIDAQEHFLKAAFDNMPQGVCTFSQDGTLLIRNTRFQNLLSLPFTLTQVGTSFGQIIEHLNERVLIGAFPHESFDGLMRFLRRAGNLRLRERHIDGPVLDIDIRPLPDGGCIVNVMDATVESQTTEQLENRVRLRTQELTEVNSALLRQHEQQARVEEDLRVAKAEVEAAMSSKTRFFAAASHDLLQPMNAAKLLISSLSEMAQDTDMARLVARLDSSFHSMESLLHALLDISRLESTDIKLVPSDFALDGVLQTVAEDLGPLASEKGLRLTVVPSKVWVKSDRRYLVRSVQNLVNNAIQYTETGRILVGCRRRGDRVVLEVWDTGIGISKANQARIFQEFTRVNASAKAGFGMGLGLSIVQRACAHLGHPVRVRSKPGVGSVFSIELPVVAPSEAGPEAQAAEAAETDFDLIVLLVENDPGVLFAMTQRLEGWGASVLACASTAEALALFDDIDMAPDIILADYQLDNGETGIDAILALRERTGIDIPAIMITANHEDTLKEARVRHNFSVLMKPVNLARLRPLIDWKTRRARAAE
ncbi:hybrid sensor histidine kinase/response regulator [Oceaniglobus roseus]|uniref:hybrid sensor histidine kinase/response regulator n=1 Tax=Oceaniglobus roseus TaxID=1737570 RepID=UPI000C7EFD43|nr:ATP-binding protein [Kandeliimicrobium roseum]